MTHPASHRTHPVPARAEPEARLDWPRIACLLATSRAVDTLEETRLLQEGRLYYQFSAGGHDLAQIILGTMLDRRHDAVNGYYRSRPMLLTLGLDTEDALAAPMVRTGSMSGGRDIGVVFNLPNRDGPCALPVCGGVGAQYTPAAGWAQAIRYRHDVLGERDYAECISVALGGDASCATNGFWSALTIATTLKLPMLFCIEDNAYGISVPSDLQTPGGDIAANLASFRNLALYSGDGTEPVEASQLLSAAIAHVRSWQGPALVRLAVPRLAGHSAQDTQAYKGDALVAAEHERDPYPKLERYLVPRVMSAREWADLEARAQADVEAALERALARPDPDPGTVTRYARFEKGEVQQQGGLAPEGAAVQAGATVQAGTAGTPAGGPRLNMLTAIRRTLDAELAANPKVLVFGEDVGPKGGVHGATLGLQEKHGEARVFDTSLSEEGIIGRAVGMALAGLMPVPEIQFRTYADPAEEQLNACGTLRWRTENRFAAPIVVRMPGGFFRCGDPWHSQTGEVKWVHAIGWRVAMPSNAEDAVGLLRTAMRGNDPTIFFEHRALLDAAWARRPYPGDDYLLPFGQARCLREGGELTVVAWGAMVPRALEAVEQAGADAEVLDLRTLAPWDRTAVLESVGRTHRCLIVHEDNLSAGFGAEIAAVLAEHAFFELDAPVRRLAMPDIPSPHSPVLMNVVVPSVEKITGAIRDILEI